MKCPYIEGYSCGLADWKISLVAKVTHMYVTQMKIIINSQLATVCMHVMK